MRKINYQALRDAAEKATQGEWVAFISPGKYGTYAVHTPGDNHHGDIVDWPGFDEQKNAENNARYIAAFNPEVVQALLDELEIKSKRINELIKGGENAKYVTEIFRLEKERMTLAAENARLNKFIVQSCYVFNGEQDELSDAYICAIDGRMPQIPATDAFLAEVRAEARNEGINYAASRLAAAFNHGFINKSLREVFDVTRMILSAKEELANEPHPIDGLSGEYAEKSLEEWAEQIRKGDSQ